MVLWGEKDAINCFSMEYVLLFERKKKTIHAHAVSFPWTALSWRTGNRWGRVFFMTFRLFLRRHYEMNLGFALTVNLI